MTLLDLFKLSHKLRMDLDRAKDEHCKANSSDLHVTLHEHYDVPMASVFKKGNSEDAAQFAILDSGIELEEDKNFTGCIDQARQLLQETLNAKAQ